MTVNVQSNETRKTARVFKYRDNCTFSTSERCRKIGEGKTIGYRLILSLIYHSSGTL